MRFGSFGGLMARLGPSGPLFELLASIVGNDSETAGRTVADALDILSGVGGPSVETDWYVDNINGNDNNDGLSPATALKTMARLSAIIGVAKLLPATGNEVRVHILADVPTDDAFSFTGVIRGNAILRLIGEATTELLAPTALTGRVNFALNSTRPTITIAGVDWAAQGLVGKRCRVISSSTAAPDTLFWVESVAGAPDTVSISRPYLFNPVGALQGAPQTLSVGDTIVVEELTECGPLSLRWRTDGTVRTVSQQVTLESVRTHVAVLAELIIGIEAGRASARFENALVFGSEVRTSFCLFTAVTSSACRYANPLAASFCEGIGEFRACSFASSQMQLRGGSEFFVSQDCSAEACQLIVGTTQTNMEASMVTILNGFSGWNWSNDAVRVRYGGRLLATGRIWGLSAVANSYGLRCSSGGELQYASAVKPTIVGALTPVQDALIGGTVAAYAAVPQVNAANLARIVVAVE
jgi:hypothetical protein